MTALRPSSVVDQALTYLRRMILQGTLAPGERLVETELAGQLGVSRATVREALRQLENEGLVETQPWRGTYVTRISQKDAEEICIARAVVESYAVRASVRIMNEHDFAELEHIIAEMHDAEDRGDVYAIAELDVAFHSLIAARADNGRIASIHRALDHQVGALIISTLEAQLLPLPKVATHHEALLERLRSRNPDAAQAAIEEHYLSIRHLNLT